MIRQAINAEIFKLVRNRWTFFWAFVAMPAFALLAGMAEETLVRVYVGDPLPYANPVDNLFSGLLSMQSSIFQIFAIAGAATLFAGEYRWETWRAILPRTERVAIMLAKLSVFALAIALCIFASGLARFLVGLYDVALTGEADWPPAPWLGLLTGFIAAFLQIMVTAAFVMLAAVVTRSMMAAIVATLVVVVALDITTIRIRLPDAELWVAALPNFASNSLSQQGLALMGKSDTIGTHLAGAGALAMIAWIAALAGTAIALFRGQDLSRE